MLQLLKTYAIYTQPQFLQNKPNKLQSKIVNLYKINVKLQKQNYQII